MANRIYSLWAPVYDLVWERLFRKPRKRTFQVLGLKPGESLHIVGVGTVQDIPYLPQGVQTTGIDLNAPMLHRAQAKAGDSPIELYQMDAQQLEFPNAQFDAVLCTLVLSVVPDGRQAFKEAWRVLKPGGRLVIFDKFLPDDQAVTAVRRLIGWVLRVLGTDPNRRLTDIVGVLDDGGITHNESGLLQGQYRIVKLVKSTDQ